MKNVIKILKYENNKGVKNHVTMIKRKYNQILNQKGGI